MIHYVWETLEEYHLERSLSSAIERYITHCNLILHSWVFVPFIKAAGVPDWAELTLPKQNHTHAKSSVFSTDIMKCVVHMCAIGCGAVTVFVWRSCCGRIIKLSARSWSMLKGSQQNGKKRRDKLPRWYFSAI